MSIPKRVRTLGDAVDHGELTPRQRGYLNTTAAVCRSRLARPAVMRSILRVGNQVPGCATSTFSTVDPRVRLWY
jgi:hypothetical protein